jgi:hypothetical protein
MSYSLKKKYLKIKSKSLHNEIAIIVYPEIDSSNNINDF